MLGFDRPKVMKKIQANIMKKFGLESDLWYVAYFLCSLCKIEAATTPAPSGVELMNYIYMF